MPASPANSSRPIDGSGTGVRTPNNPWLSSMSNDDHAAIVAALADGDMARAPQLMREHIDTLAARLDETLAHSGTRRARLHAALTPTRARKPAR